MCVCAYVCVDMCDLIYVERLNKINALTVANQHTFADTVFIVNFIHKRINCSAAGLGMFPLDSITRGSGCRLQQRCLNSKTCANFFCFRAVSTKIKLPSNIVTSKTLSQFIFL